MEKTKLYSPNAPIKLIGLDLDGTVFDNKKCISERTKNAIREAIKQGVVVVPATGRPLAGVSKEFAEIEGVKYALTANGAAIYNMETKECIYKDTISTELVCEVISKLEKYDIMIDVFIDGMGYVEHDVLAKKDDYVMSEEIRKYIMDTRKTVSNLVEYIEIGNYLVEKITVNFKVDATTKNLLYKKEVMEVMAQYPQLVCVSGVPTNLEITMATAHKGNAMIKLGELLGIKREEIMACGDSGNDMAMIVAAGFGVAMENGTDEVKQAANYITASNEEDGVAYVIEKFVLKRE